MRPEIDCYLNLLERRLDRLRCLARELKESQAAFTAMDLERITHYVDYQENLCDEIRSLDVQIRGLNQKLNIAFHTELNAVAPETLFPYLDEGSGRKLRVIARGLANIQAEVKRLNRVQSEMLRRSRQSVNVLINVMAQYTCRFELYPALVPAGMALEVKE